MTKKNQKIIPVTIIFLLFFSTFLFFSYKVAFAILEVPDYPTISSQTITATTELPDFAIYLFNAGMFIGFFSVFISLVIAGVMYFLSPAIPHLLSSAKDRISGAISGLLILALTYLIITTINPQLSVFMLTKTPDPPPVPIVTPTIPGVTFYISKDCSDGGKNTSLTKMTSENDLKLFKNEINSAGIEHGGSAYISIIYDEINFKGKCLYLNPNIPCNKNIEPFAASASVYQYSFRASGDIIFYRNSYFDEPAVPDKTGGYYKITSKDIMADKEKIFIKKLSDLRFIETEGKNKGKCTVPEEEQDCIKYDAAGKCAKDGRTCPSLGGENISSIKINGNYLVVLFYFRENNGTNEGEKKDAEEGPWTACQEFPTVYDINKTGPQQIKWQFIRNSGGIIPNYIMIIPIKK